jgi:hypothetical protein
MTETTTTSGYPALTICRAGAATDHPCTRPVGTESLYLGEAPTLCAEHYRSAYAAEEAADWNDAHDAILERIGPLLDHERPGRLEALMGTTLEEVRRETARAYGEYDKALWMLEHDHETHGKLPLAGREDMERGYRLLNRADRLTYAIAALYGDGKDLSPERWGILAVLQEVQEEATAELLRWKADR